MNNLTVFSRDLSGTYHGIGGSPIYLQEKKFRVKYNLSMKKQTVSFENILFTSIFASIESCS